MHAKVERTEDAALGSSVDGVRRRHRRTLVHGPAFRPRCGSTNSKITGCHPGRDHLHIDHVYDVHPSDDINHDSDQYLVHHDDRPVCEYDHDVDHKSDHDDVDHDDVDHESDHDHVDHDIDDDHHDLVPGHQHDRHLRPFGNDNHHRARLDHDRTGIDDDDHDVFVEHGNHGARRRHRKLSGHITSVDHLVHGITGLYGQWSLRPGTGGHRLVPARHRRRDPTPSAEPTKGPGLSAQPGVTLTSGIWRLRPDTLSGR